MIEEAIKRIVREAFKELLPDLRPKSNWITREQIRSDIIDVSDSVIRQWEDDGLPYTGQKPKIYSREEVNNYLSRKINEHTRYPRGRN